MRSAFNARILWSYSKVLAPVFAVVIGSIAGAVFAADVTSTWSTATSGNWNVNANWTNVPALGGFPNNGNGGVATYDAVISPLGSPYTVTLNTTVTVEDLLLGSANATVDQTSGTFAATGAITLSAGTFQVDGGTISNTTVNETSKNLLIAAANNNLLSGVTVNGDLTLNTTSARTKIAGGTTFNTAHLAANAVSLGFAPSQTLSETILFEGAATGIRHVEMNGTAGSFTIGTAGVIRTNTGLTGDGDIGAGFSYGGAMTLTNNGLISSQVSGRTITINPASLANSATGILEATGGGILTIGATNWTNVGNVRALTGSTANLNGAWSDLGGTITADATSTLNFGGSFSTPNLGTLSLAAGSSVDVTGVWDNSGQNFTLNAATGSWTLNGGSISGGGIGFADSKNLLIAAANNNLLSGVTVNGDLTLNTTSARTKIAGGTTFNTAHLAANAVSLGFAPSQTLSETILFEGAATGIRHVEMNGTAGSFTIGTAGVIRTNTGLTGDGDIGAGFSYGGAMTLTNNGLISSQVSGRTITINPATSFTNAGIVEATNGGNLVVPLGYTQTAGITRLSGGGSISALNGATTSTITVGGGELDAVGTISANVADSTTIAVSPGLSAGRLTITGDLTLASTSTLQIGIGGVHPGTDSDLLSEAGTTALNLAGVLNVTLINGYVPTAADSLVVVSSNQPVTGMFSNVVGGRVTATDGTTSLKVTVVGNHVVLNLLAGDYNHNAVVDAADYTVWRDSLGQSGPALAADGNGNGVIDSGDYDVWKANYGNHSGSGAAVTATVPEPATFVLMILAAAGLCLKRRGRTA